MKKIIILVTLLMFTFNYTRAQEDNPPAPVPKSHSKKFKSVMLGVKASPNIGWLNPDTKNYKSEGVIFGFSWGFMCEFAFTENYSFATGFNVIASNGKLTYPHQMKIDADSVFTLGSMSREYKLRYLEIPFTLKMRTRDFGKFSFYGQIGLGLGFNIRAKSSDEFTYGTSTLTSDESIKDQVSFFRLGLLLGAGAEFSLGGTTRLTAGFGYNNSLFDILTKKNTVNNSIEEDAKSSFVDFTLGILF